MAKKTNEFLQAHIVHHGHYPCYPCSLLVSSLADRIKLYLLFCTLCRSWLSLCRPPYGSTNSQANRRSSVFHHVSHECLCKRLLAAMLSIGHFGVVVSRTRTSSSLARQSPIAPRIRVHFMLRCACFLALVSWPLPSPGQLMLLFTIVRAN